MVVCAKRKDTWSPFGDGNTRRKVNVMAVHETSNFKGWFLSVVPSACCASWTDCMGGESMVDESFPDTTVRLRTELAGGDHPGLSGE